MRICGGELRGRPIRTIEGPGYRPAMSMVREALFSMLDSQGIYWPDTRVLDLFAGSGSLSFEALSRGAPEALCVESNPQAAALIQKNTASLGLAPERCRVAKEEVSRFLGRKNTRSYELIFIDPPYGFDHLTPSIRGVLKNGLLAPAGFLIAELEAKPPKGSKGVDMDKIPPELRLETDRNYGQTRIVIWTLNATEK